MKNLTSLGLFACVFCCLSVSSCAASCALKTCIMRYELTAQLHALWQYNTCTDVFNFACVCNKSIDVLYGETPPYIYTDPTSKQVVGILPGILNEVLKTCCNECTRVRYLKPIKTVNEGIARLRSATILLPIMAASGSKTFTDDTFVAFFQTKGVAYVTIKELNMEQFIKFFDSIVSNWPLLLICFLLAVDAGVLVWLLDCWSNSEEFPLAFHKGVVEGLWWAYVTMTTVGYGDKTPKSLPARAFAVIWVTIGISLSGIFTASLITGMTQSFLEGPLRLNGKNIGVLNSTRYEYQIAMRESANIQEFSSYAELKVALQTQSVDGILMDVISLSHFYNDLKKDVEDLHIRIDAIKNTETSIGMVFPYEYMNATNKEWGTFISRFFKDNQDNMNVMLQVAKKGLKLTDISTIIASEKNSQLSIFHSKNIYNLMFKYVGLATLVLFLFGFSFEKIRPMVKMYIASRQDKRTNKIEARATEVVEDKVELYTADSSGVELRERFQSVMKEIEIEEKYANYSKLTEKVLERVFSYTVKRGSKETEVF